MFPLHIALASTSRSSSDVVEGNKAGPDALLTPTNIRVIQLVEMPAPPRRIPPSSASASSSSSSSLASSSAASDMDLDAEELEEDCDSYCSSAADGDDEEERAAKEAEADKIGRILAWRARTVTSPPIVPHYPLSPTTPKPRLVPPPLSLSPTTPTRVRRKRSAASASSSCSSSSVPRSKRSRTSSVQATAGPSESSRLDASAATTRPRPEKPLFLAPPSPTNLARRHTSPRHQRHSSSPAHPYPSTVPTPILTLNAPHSPTTPTPADYDRTMSMSTAVSTRDTLCPACDRAFNSTRAFRVHALHSADADTSVACGAAVAYAMEDVRAP
ncbi:hypothetical protein DFH06DRAFT_1471077 [Mycena polygramma]|nr:hypothetical protein DFH06DRAFT_1471077 [Mycena polygramma]